MRWIRKSTDHRRTAVRWFQAVSTTIAMMSGSTASAQIPSRLVDAEPKFTYRDEVVFKRRDTTLESNTVAMPSSDRLVYRVTEVVEQSNRVRVESADDYAHGWTTSDQIVPLPRALEFFTHELETHPQDADSRVMRARLELDLKRFDEAEEDLDRAIQLDRNRASYFVQRAMVRIYRGQPDEALADCDQAMKLDPRDPWSHAIRALVWLLKNDYQRADRDLDDLIRLDDPKPSDWSLRFREWLHERPYDALSSAVHLEPVKIDETTVTAHLWRADIAIRKADASRAIVEYGKALQLEPDNALIHALRAQAWAAKYDRPREAADYARAIELQPSKLDYRLARGAAWSAQGRHELAVADFNEVIRIAPDDTAGYLFRGNEYRKHLKLDQAISDYNRAIEVDPRCSQAYINRGLIWKQRRDFEQAVGEFQNLLQWDATNVEGHRTLARILATCNNEHIRDGRRAVLEATAACELTGWQEPDCLDTLAAAQAESGDFTAAVDTQTRAIRLLRYRPPSPLQRSLNFGGRRGVGFQDRLAFYKTGKPCRE